jgi:retinol dehydrogenase-12
MLEYFVYPAVVLLILFIIRKIANGPETPLKDQADLRGKVVIVTGSNTGIGKVSAMEMLSKGANVVFASRDQQKTLAVIDGIKNSDMRLRAHFIKLDLGSFESIKDFVETFQRKYHQLDILVNNAGATFDTFSLRENIERTIMTNHIGPVFLTSLLIKFIGPQGKIINVSSRGHKQVGPRDLTYLYAGQDSNFSNMENDHRHLMLYCLSKMGNVYHARFLADYFMRNGLQIKTASLHPGFVHTDIFSPYRLATLFKKIVFCMIAPFVWLTSKDVYMGAQTTLHLAYMDFDKMNSGAYYSNCSEEKLKDFATDRERIEEYMNFTKKQIVKNCPDLPEYALDFINH